MDAKSLKQLTHLRKLAFALPDVVETESFGHPWFRAGGPKGKMIAVFGGYPGDHNICFKAGLENMDVFLKDPRFYKTSHIGHRGWVSLRLNAAKIDWNEIAELLEMSYRNNAPKKLVQRLDHHA